MCFIKIENVLAEVLRIIFSDIQHYQIKQIIQIIINQSTIFIQIIKINTKKEIKMY